MKLLILAGVIGVGWYLWSRKTNTPVTAPRSFTFVPEVQVRLTRTV